MILSKPTQFKDFISIVKRNIASFISLAILFGVSFTMFCGVPMAIDNQEYIINLALIEGKAHVVNLTFPEGISQSQIEETFGGLDGVTAKGRNTTSDYFVFDENRYQAHIYSLTEGVDEPNVIEGNIPTGEGEIAVQKSWAEKYNVKIGDQIDFENFSGTSILTGLSYKVTGLIETSEFMTQRYDFLGSNPLDGIPYNVNMYVDESAFDRCLIPVYTEVCIYEESIGRENIFADEYTEKEEEFCDIIKEKADELGSTYYLSTKSQLTISYIYVVIRDILQGIRWSLTGLFLVVGLFVSYAVVSRMVHDHITLIGTKNANGMTFFEIFKLYLGFNFGAYALAALALGPVGCVIYIFTIQLGLSGTYTDFEKPFTIYIAPYIVAIVGMLFFVIAITLISVFGVMKLSVIKQLAGEIQVLGKQRFYEKFKFWKKLPILSKSMFNNLLNEKKRVIGTILGVAGCTAITVSCFTFSNLILNSYDYHYENYFFFDHIIRFIPTDETVQEDIQKILDEKGITYTPMYMDYLVGQSEDGEYNQFYLNVFYDEEGFKKLVKLYSSDNKNQKLGKGFYISNAIQKEYDLSPGDYLDFQLMTSEEFNVKIDDFYTNYLFEITCYSHIDSYEERFGKRPTPNAFYLVIDNESAEELNRELMNIPSYIGLIDNCEQTETAFNVIAIIMMFFRVLFVGISILMAFAVLLNMISVFIMEKKRDVITLMINGYEVSKAKKYIMVDIIALSAIGIVFGTGLGIFFGNATTSAFESGSCRFLTGVSGWAILIGVGIMLAIGAVICLKALKKIESFKLGDINS